MRITVATAQALAALLADADADHYGLELMKSSGLASGTLYPILRRLTGAGWLSAHWEDVDPVEAGRPARRYYRLTALGATEARSALAELRARTTPPGTAPGAGAPAW